MTPAAVWHFYDGRAGMERRILLHKSSRQMPVFRAILLEDSEFHAGFR